MENLIWDGVPAQRKKREEKYSFPVVTMVALDKPGAGRKFIFNKAAQELLDIQGEDRISFGFSTDRTIIAVRKAVDINAGIQLTKTCTISDKKTYEFIAKILNLDTTKENDFVIESKNDLNILVLKSDEVVEEMPETPESVEESVEESEEEFATDEFDDVEVNIDDMPFVLDPEFAPSSESESNNETSEEDVW